MTLTSNTDVEETPEQIMQRIMTQKAFEYTKVFDNKNCKYLNNYFKGYVIIGFPNTVE